MNILWDMRLFSTGYRDRGVGMYCRETARSLLEHRHGFSLHIWADPEQLPEQLAAPEVTVIPFRGGSWKSTFYRLPLLAFRYRIALVHYWVALGPLRSIGIAPLPGVSSIATVHDLGVERWDTPHGRFLKNTPYWKIQRIFIASVNAILTNSRSTRQEVLEYLPVKNAVLETAYPPLFSPEATIDPAERKPYFIALGGGPHKNIKRVVQAFAAIRKKHPKFRLLLLGRIDPSELPSGTLPEGISLEPSMERYGEHLRRCSGLVFCSLSEGLGIPPLEALQYGCPLLLSDIPPIRETCDKAGIFVNPASVRSIFEGLEALIADPHVWSERAITARQSYQSLSAGTPERIYRLYRQLTGKRHSGKSAGRKV